MFIKKLGNTLIPLFTFILILSVSAAVIAYGKGYRLDIIKKSIKPTGLIAATSDPTGAQVLIDGKLTTATNNSININPGFYTVTIAKEGFQNWEKKLRVQGEVVTRADAYLFPTNPSLSTLSTNGVVHPVLSPDGAKLAYIVPEENNATEAGTLINRAGVWVLDLTERPLGFNRDPRQIAKSSYVDFSEAILTWSPDSKQLLATITNSINSIKNYYILESDRLNDSPLKVYDILSQAAQWQTLAAVKDQERVSSFKPDLALAASTFMKIISFAPDETKFLYEASVSGIIPQIINPPLVGTNSTAETRDIKPGSVYVYDIKEDRNYLIGDKNSLGFTASVSPTPTPKYKGTSAPASDPPQVARFSIYTTPPPIQWLPTNRHLVIVAKGKIEAMDYDATNRKTIYAGPFWDSFVAPWANASRFLILTTLNPLAGNTPNLYAVNLR